MKPQLYRINSKGHSLDQSAFAGTLRRTQGERSACKGGLLSTTSSAWTSGRFARHPLLSRFSCQCAPRTTDISCIGLAEWQRRTWEVGPEKLGL